MVGRCQPRNHLQDEDEGGEAQRAPPVAAPHFQVAPREQRRAQKDHEEDQDDHRLHDPVRRAFRHLPLARGPVPRVDDLKADELVLVGRGLDADGAVGLRGVCALPRRALVERLLRSPFRLGRFEVRRVKPRLGEGARPVERLRVRRLDRLRRRSREADHPPRTVEQHARHPRDGARRVELRDFLSAERHEVARTLAIPEAERHGPARLQPVPAVRRTVALPDVAQILVVYEEAVGGVGRRVVAELPGDIAGALLQTLDGLFERHAAVQQSLVGEDH